MIVTIYFKDDTTYTFKTEEENITRLIELIETRFKDKIGFKIEKEKLRSKNDTGRSK